MATSESAGGALARAARPGGLGYWWTRNQIKVMPYLFIAPFFILFLIFLAYPIVDAFVLSFMRQQGIQEPTFVGLTNYTNMVQDPRYLRSLSNTSLFALGSVFILSPLAFILAITINSRLVPWPNAKSVYRLAFFVPLLTSAVVVSLMFGILYDYQSGFLNGIIASLLGEEAKVGWIRDPKVALWSILILAIWQFTGLNSLYFLAGLQNIPKEMEEAAIIDGAGRWALLTRITLPLLRPVILFVVVQAINGSYHLFIQPYLLTGGGPSDATVTMTMYLYQTGFSYFNLGYASAIGYSLVVIIVALALAQLWLFGAFRED
ncbi:MAG TPA: sugar ABC transporter permease [Chloroflexota bacterium]|nr:sugar ABC transporter permease [Chloroflexota bacterium]